MKNILCLAYITTDVKDLFGYDSY